MQGQKPPVFRCLGTLEREAREAGYGLVAGVDEVGRGCLFGPVFAAAVILDPARPIAGLKDSKVVSAADRDELATRIRERAIAFAIGAADPFEIDRINIYQASRLAMKRAVNQLWPQPNFLLVDAVKLEVALPQKAIIHGDARSRCIAAASILAKTARDQCMRAWDAIFPQYGLKDHKGYATPEHYKALAQYGPTTLHRFSFEPVRACRAGMQAELFVETEPGVWI